MATSIDSALWKAQRHALVLALVLFSAGCTVIVPEEADTEIVFSVRGAKEETKTIAVTQIAELQWCTTTGGDYTGNDMEILEWTDEQNVPFKATVVSGRASTGKYVSRSHPGQRNYYGSNTVFDTSSRMLYASNTQDILVGRTFGTSAINPDICLNHIFARLGSMEIHAQEGYSISGISWAIRRNDVLGGTSGYYNIQTGSWTACMGLSTDTSVWDGMDLYLIPAEYVITCNYTLSRGIISVPLSASANVFLPEGKISNITGTAVGGPDPNCTFSVDFTEWSIWDDGGELILE